MWYDMFCRNVTILWSLWHIKVWMWFAKKSTANIVSWRLGWWVNPHCHEAIVIVDIKNTDQCNFLRYWSRKLSHVSLSKSFSRVAGCHLILTQLKKTCERNQLQIEICFLARSQQTAQCCSPVSLLSLLCLPNRARQRDIRFPLSLLSADYLFAFV